MNGMKGNAKERIYNLCGVVVSFANPCNPYDNVRNVFLFLFLLLLLLFDSLLISRQLIIMKDKKKTSK